MGTVKTCITVTMAMMLVMEPADCIHTGIGWRLNASRHVPSVRKTTEALRKLPPILGKPETNAEIEAANMKDSSLRPNRVPAMLSKAIEITLTRNSTLKEGNPLGVHGA
jgi:hypothetical protein